MIKRIVLIFFIMTLNILTFACGRTSIPTPNNTTVSDKVTTEKIKLFYGSAGNEKIVTEEREITFNNPDDKFKVVLEELIAGPTNKTLQNNIPKNTTVYGIIRQNKDLIIDLNSNFTGFPGSMAEIIGVGSIVNTMTQFDDIERVKILVEGEEFIGPSGEPRGFMREFPLEP